MPRFVTADESELWVAAPVLKEAMPLPSSHLPGLDGPWGIPAGYPECTVKLDIYRQFESGMSNHS